VKKGRLSLEEKQFVFDNKKTLSVAEIAQKLDRSEVIVKTLIDSNWAPVTVKTGLDLKSGAFGKKDGVAVMTEAASMAADEFVESVTPRRHQVDYIHKIDPNKRIR